MRRRSLAVDAGARAVIAALSASLVSFCVHPTRAQNDTSDALLDVALHHPAERDGDYDALAAAWLEALPEHAEDPRADLLARRLLAVTPWLREPGALAERVAALLADARARGPAQVILSRWLAAHYRRVGRREEARALDDATGLVRRFLVIGPFGKDRDGALARSFPPEERVDLEARYRDGWQDLEWREVETPESELDPFEHLTPRRGAAYALVQVYVETPQEAILHLGATNELKVWHDGSAVLDDTQRRTFLASYRPVGARLASGWNRVLVKTEGRFSLRITASDATPFPVGTLRIEGARVLHPLAEGAAETWDGPFTRRASERWRAGLEDRDSASQAPDSAAAHEALEWSGLAILCALEGRDDLAVEAAEAALAKGGDDPWVLHHAASVLEGASYLPQAQAKSRAKDAWTRAVAADPGFLPAQERLARLLARDQETAAAVRILEAALARNPRFLPGLLRLERVFAEREWEVEEREALRRIALAAPELALPDLAEARRYERRDNPVRTLELYRAAYEKDRTQAEVLVRIARLEAARGRLAEAEAALRERAELEEHSTAASAELAALLLRAGRAGEALELLRRHVASREWDPEAHRALGDLLSEAGRGEEALAAYRRTLELAPGDIDLAGYLSAARGESDEEEFWRSYDEALEEWVPRVPADGSLVDRAAAVCVLDIAVVKVRVDGSSSEYVHQAFQLRSEEAKDDIAKVSTPGEVIRLRTLTRRGESLEPVAALGKGSYVLPGMEPGVFTEIAFRIDRKHAGGAAFRHDPFYFQDTRYQQPFLLSRMVFLFPPGIESDVVETALASAPPSAEVARVERSERELPDGTRAIVYETRNAPRLQPERAMPPADEYVPRVDVRPRRTARYVEESMRLQVAEAALSTPELRDAARKATEGIDDPLEKARALYRFANDLVASENGPRAAVQVLLEKAGDRTALFKALLDEAGVPSAWAFVREAERFAPAVDWSYPSAAYFPWRFVCVEVPERDPLWVTLRFRRLPFGEVPERFAGGRAYVLRPEGAELRALPPPAGERASRMEGTIRLGTDTSAKVELRATVPLLEGYLAKDALRDLDSFRKNLALRAQANQMYPGAKLERAQFSGLDDFEAPFGLELALTAPKLLTESGDDLLLAPVAQPGQFVRVYGGPRERKHPYVLRQPREVRSQRDSFRVVPGESLAIERFPADVSLVGKIASYSLSYRRDGLDLLIERRVEIGPGRLEPGEFPAFLGFLQAADAAEAERIVLRRR